MPDQGLQFPYLNPTSDNVSGFLDLQRKQQLAQMLMGAAQQTASTPAGWDSMRVVPKRSALSNVTALATALMAGKAQRDLPKAQADYYQGLMGGGAPAQGAPAAPAPQEAPNMPPPMIRSPDYQPPAPAASGLAQPPAQPQSNPMLLTGEPRTSQMLLGMMGQQEYAKALAGKYAPTDMEKMLTAAHIDPASPEGQQALRANIEKSNYIAPTAVRPGSVALGPDGQPKFFNPTSPEGSMPQFGPNGFPTSIVPIPGGAAATATASAEKQAGTVSQTPQKVGTDAQGQDVFKFLQPPALGGTSSGAPAGGIRAPLTASPATVQSQKSGAEAGQSYASELSKNATGATEVRRSLSELKNLAKQATPGAMNEGKMKLGSYMIAAGVSPQTAASWLGVDVGALQAAQKQTATLAVNTIHSMTSRGTNFDLDTFMRNNPNLNMSDPSAFQKVVDYMDNKSKQEVAKQKDFVQWKKGVSPDEWESGHTAHWLEKQNQDIDAGQSNSRPPLSSFLRP